MRRILAGIAAILLIVTLAVPARAATGASSIQNQTLVSSNGTCQVVLNLTLHLEGGVDALSFPLPGNAKSVTVNGSGARGHRSGDVLEVDLSRLVGGLVGDFALIISYSVPNAVKTDGNGKLILTVPMLSGFAYPISEMSFTITLPGEVTAHPSFTSGYFQTSIESCIAYTEEGTAITGYFTQPLKDRETLAMVLEVPKELFPQDPVKQWRADMDDIAMYVCAGLALLYWLIFLRCLPPRRLRVSGPPEGLTAGDMGSALTGRGPDLTMMVLSWAQMGYILIHLDRNGRVILHKRMEMGNERGAFEVRCFRTLFGKRQMVDGTGDAYARLCRSLMTAPANTHGWFRPGSGNPRILRILAAGIGVFGGMSLAIALGGDSILTGLLIFLMCLAGGAASWIIQSGAACLFLHDKAKLWLGLGCCALWFILGAIAGEPGIAAGVVAAQVLFGTAAAYSGRRNPVGRQAMAQVLGLRRYLRTADPIQVQRIFQTNPEYFFSLAPYALAFGVEQDWAKRFGAVRLPGCPYLTTGMDGHRTALEWARLMRKAVSALEEKQKRLPYEQLLSVRVTMDPAPRRSGTQPKRRRK